jgi:hypothetical protein
MTQMNVRCKLRDRTRIREEQGFDLSTELFILACRIEKCWAIMVRSLSRLVEQIG